MSHAVIWDAATPLGSADPVGGDDQIRDIKAAVVERMAFGGIKWTTDTILANQNDDGKIAAGIQATDLLTFYETDLTTTMCSWNDLTEIYTLGTGKAGSWTLKCGTTDTGTVDTNNLIINTGWTPPANMVISTNIAVGNCTKGEITSAGSILCTAGAGYVTLASTTITTTLTPGARMLVLCSLQILPAGTGTYSIKIQADRDGSTGWATDLTSTTFLQAEAPITGGAEQLVSWHTLDTSASSNDNTTAVGYRIQLSAVTSNITVTASRISVVELIR